jgi:hypothetical protein
VKMGEMTCNDPAPGDSVAASGEDRGGATIVRFLITRSDKGSFQP